MTAARTRCPGGDPAPARLRSHRACPTCGATWFALLVAGLGGLPMHVRTETP